MIYFTLAVSTATPERCAMLTDRARIADPAIMPIPGPAKVVWRSPDGRAAVIRWGEAGWSNAGRDNAGQHGAGDRANAAVASHAGTIWIGDPTPGSGRTPVCARTSITRVDPVYAAEIPGAVIVADRATWAAWTAGRLDDHDPLHVCALLNPGFPLGAATPFGGVSALSPATTLHLLNGELTRIPTPVGTQVPRFAVPRTAGTSRPSVRLSAPRPVETSAADSAADVADAADAGVVQTGLAGLGLAEPEPAGVSAGQAGGGQSPPANRAGAGQDGVADGTRVTAGDRVTGGDSTTGGDGTTGGRVNRAAVGPTSGHTASGAGDSGPVDSAPVESSSSDSGLVGASPAGPGRGGARAVADALVAAVGPLRDLGGPVELSLTGGKDSRLIAAALVTAGVPVVAQTHGFPDHPDVVVAAEIARRLGIEHIVRTPAAPGQEIDVLARIRATVLVADGMLSAFENVGRPDPAPSPVITAGGHGGELLRGGYAETAAGKPRRTGGLRAALDPARRAVRGAEMFRRLTARHLGLLRRGPAASYVASLAPWSAALARGPLPALDDFYLVNRAGRWSAAARQAYLIRERLVQPLFDDQVVLAARAVPLADRVSGRLSAAVLAELSPALTDIPLAGKPTANNAPFDWRRQYGDVISLFLRSYILDQGTAGGLFEVVNRRTVENLLAPPHGDRATVWALATLACLLSGDYRLARDSSPYLAVS